jgi:hypothetical protein
MAIECHHLALPSAYQTSQNVFAFSSTSRAIIGSKHYFIGIGNWQDKFLGQSVVILWFLTVLPPN